jgi:hypothetical protein
LSAVAVGLNQIPELAKGRSPIISSAVAGFTGDRPYLGNN